MTPRQRRVAASCAAFSPVSPGRLQAESRVEIAAHQPVLDFRSFGQKRDQLLTIMDDDVGLGAHFISPEMMRRARNLPAVRRAVVVERKQSRVRHAAP
jgi:hypothetical protein